MSQFIVPLTSLPTLPSITETKSQQGAQSEGQVPFASLLSEAVQNLEASSELSREGMYDLALGQNDDLHTGAVQALKTSTAVNFTAGLTRSVINAYNELMRMQV